MPINFALTGPFGPAEGSSERPTAGMGRGYQPAQRGRLKEETRRLLNLKVAKIGAQGRFNPRPYPAARKR
jgi:hypothetical protein